MMTGYMALRQMESLAGDFTAVLKRKFKVKGRIADNTIGAIIASLNPSQMQRMLWDQVRAMLHRKQLTKVPGMGIGVLAVDGKQIAYSARKMSRYAQKVKSGDKEFYKLHMLRAVLTGVVEKVVVWQHPVGSKKNEITGAKKMLKDLFKLDPAKRLFELITFDAMFMVYPLTKMISDAGRYWLAPIKENQPDMCVDARAIADEVMQERRPEYITNIEHDGHTYKHYEIWRVPEFAGWETSSHTWAHLTQLLVVRVVYYSRVSGRGMDARLHKEEKDSVRVYATSLPWDRLSAKQTLTAIRSHWSIEDNCFNSLDLQFNEDKLRPFTRGEGTLNRSFLILMAYNMLQLWRHRKSKQKWDGGKIWMTWKDAFKDFFIAFTTYYPAKFLDERCLSKL